MVLTITLPVFEGPLDLLLYLVEKQELDIYNVDVAAVANQYLAHLQAMQELDLELASEFFVMAVRLLGLKVRALLPSPAPGTSQDEGASAPEDPRATLIRELMDYRRCRDRAHELGALAARQGQRFPRAPGGLAGGQYAAAGPVDDEILDPDCLSSAFRAARARTARRMIIIPADTLTVRRRMAQLLARLRGRGSSVFAGVCSTGTSRRDFVVTMLAILELLRRQRVTAQQPGPFADIEVHLRRNTARSETGRREAVL